MANESATSDDPNRVPAGRPGRRVRRTDADDMPKALLEFHSPSAGMIATPIKPMARSMSLLITLLVFGFIMIASFAPLDRVVSGAGTLSSLDSTIVVQPFDQAIVHSIDVREGDIVKPGQVIARLDPTLSEADVINLRALEQSLSAQVARLTAETQGVDYKPSVSNPYTNQEVATFLKRRAEYDAHVSDYEHQIAGFKAQLAGDQASAAAYADRLKLASQVQAMRMKLQADEVGSRLETLGAQDNVAEMQRSEAGAIESANSDGAKVQSTEQILAAYLANFKAQAYSDLTEAQRKLGQSRDDLARADLRHKLIVFRASKPAVVLTIAKVSVGSVLSPGQDFITLMPADTRFEVNAKIPANQSGYVRLGDKVQIKFETFPFMIYGGAVGTVTNVSADSFSKGHDGATDSSSLGGGDGETYYQARIAIDKYTLHNTPRGFHLTPGMPVGADIKVGTRTIMQFMLSGIMPTLSQGMREP